MCRLTSGCRAACLQTAWPAHRRLPAGPAAHSMAAPQAAAGRPSCKQPGCLTTGCRAACARKQHGCAAGPRRQARSQTAWLPHAAATTHQPAEAGRDSLAACPGGCHACRPRQPGRRLACLPCPARLLATCCPFVHPSWHATHSPRPPGNTLHPAPAHGSAQRTKDPSKRALCPLAVTRAIAHSFPCLYLLDAPPPSPPCKHHNRAWEG